jgi:SAM-dependent methyltransferase
MAEDLNRKEEQCSWYENWFDSEYYHILYGNRDQAEAETFMKNLIQYLSIPPKARIHDLACGKGRHSVFLSSEGFEVTGTDLSAESIRFATQFENDSLSFFRSDMRTTIRYNYFNFVFNLFTSFGYFGSDKDNEEVIRAVYASLLPGGIFVLDYLNTQKVRKELIGNDTKEAGGIRFHISKRLENGYFIKKISFKDKGHEYHFREQVRAFSKEELVTFFLKNGFETIELKGDYALAEFDEQHSDRLILIGKKK